MHALQIQPQEVQADQPGWQRWVLYKSGMAEPVRLSRQDGMSKLYKSGQKIWKLVF